MTQQKSEEQKENIWNALESLYQTEKDFDCIVTRIDYICEELGIDVPLSYAQYTDYRGKNIKEELQRINHVNKSFAQHINQKLAQIMDFVESNKQLPF